MEQTYKKNQLVNETKQTTAKRKKHPEMGVFLLSPRCLADLWKRVKIGLLKINYKIYGKI